ncbi:hypothetical protein GCM10009539_51000 [Cryptosporangium japonicum]|uniref:Uncharacterized protein n=1 Tax=Cryptosporangium japonicum TaxID=80872 RepID=A0ABN0URN3_9ACTN
MVAEFFEGVAYESAEVTVPCCGSTVALNSLRYPDPRFLTGFATFDVDVTNPHRSKDELDADELAALGAILGHPVLQILGHW